MRTVRGIMSEVFISAREQFGNARGLGRSRYEVIAGRVRAAQGGARMQPREEVEGLARNIFERYKCLAEGVVKANAKLEIEIEGRRRKSTTRADFNQPERG
jgi:hypothetical protein